MAILIRSGDFVGRGERAAAAHLETTLPDSWTVIANKTLVSPEGSTREIDFIVVGDHVVFCLDEKSYRGTIKGDDKGWVLQGGRSAGNPISKIEMVGRQLQGYLRASVPRLDMTLRGQFWMYCGVLLSSDDVACQVNDPRVPSQVLRLVSCADEMVLVDRSQSPKGSIGSFRNLIVEQLTKLAHRPKVPAAIGDFEVLEVLRRRGDDLSLRCRHHNGSERILELVARSESAVPERVASAENAALREYLALERIAPLARAPEVDPYFSWNEGEFWVVPIHLVDGVTLRADRHRASTSATDVASVVIDSYEALAQLHASDVTHRNISPDCVLIADGRRIVFTDFDFARLGGQPTLGSQSTWTSDPYTAPEIRVAAGFAVPESDVYSLTCALLYWLVGLEPDTGEAWTLADDAAAQASGLLWPEVVPVLRRCLVEDERLRPTAQEVAVLLRDSRPAVVPAELAAPPELVDEVVGALLPQASLEDVEPIRAAPEPEGLGGNDGQMPRFEKPGIINTRYVLLPETLIAGGIADVYRAVDLRDPDVPVAVKLIRDLDREDWVVRLTFERETASLRTLLKHENVVRLLDSGRDSQSGQHFLVLEWIPRTLSDHLGEQSALREWPSFAAAIAVPLARALAHAHEKRVIHRDVKPSNVLVTDEGVPKLADFGISALKSRLPSGPETLAHYATPPYAPPEGQAATDYDRDVYAFGVLVIESLSGGSIESYLDIGRALDTLAVPEPVFDLLRRCVADDPSERPQNGLVLLAELEQIGVAPAEISVRPELHLLVNSPFLLDQLDKAALSFGVGTPYDFLVDELAEGAVGRRAPDSETGDRQVWLTGRSWRFLCQMHKTPPQLWLISGKELDPGRVDFERETGTLLPFRFRTGLVSDQAAAAAAMRELDDRLQIDDDRRGGEDELRDERRLFAQWLNQLRAEEDFEGQREDPLPYVDARVEGQRLHVTLEAEPVDEVVGQSRIVKSGNHYDGRFRGTVASCRGRILELWLDNEPPVGPPRRGTLAFNTGPSSVAIRRQRDALYAVRYQTSDLERLDLPDLILRPDRVVPGTAVEVSSWFQPELDEDKQRAVSQGLGATDVFLVQGPPGTGKTTFIAELIAQEIQRDPQIRILLTSQTHVALDHALEALRPVLPAGARMVRLAPPGDTRVDERVADLLLERQLPPWRREIRRKSEQYLERWAMERGLDVDRVKAAIMLRELAVLRQAIEELEVADDPFPDDGESPAPASPDATEEADANATEQAEAEADRQRDVQDLERDIRTLSLTLAPLLSMKRSQVVNLSLEEVERLYQSGISAGGPDSTTLEGLIRLQSDWLDKAARGTEFDQAFLKVSQVVAATCVGLAGFASARDLSFDLCILDEASKAAPTEALVPFVRSRRWLLVGDQRQLKPFQEHALRSEQMLQKFDLDPTALGMSIFDVLATGLPDRSRVLLSRQHRMVKAIGDLISHVFYGGQLVSERTDTIEALDLALPQPVTWFDSGRVPHHRERRAGEGRVSFDNPAEGNAIVEFLGRLAFYRRARKSGNRPMSVLVLSAYRPQVSAIQAAVDGHLDQLDGLSVEVLTVDAAQGQEADVLVYSVTRSNPEGAAGFLNERSRINVALSRARFGLAIFGDLAFCEGEAGPLREVIEYMRDHMATCEVVDLAT